MTKTTPIYFEDVELVNYEGNIALAEATYNLAKVTAEILGITLEEYFDFIQDMADDRDIESLDIEEVQQMYVEYCAEYDIPCTQFADYDCIDKMGW